MTSKRRLIARLKRYTAFDSELHGPAHWSRVHRFGRMLAGHLNLSERQTQCVEVFAWTHDLARLDDGGGNVHAIDGATYALKVMDELFADLRVADRRLVSVAVRHHSDSMTAEDAYYRGLLDVEGWSEDQIIDTVGACWDADRLDLLRFGIEPVGDLMSTDAWEDVLPFDSKPGGSAPIFEGPKQQR